MERLTTNKDVKNMSMYELALNCCYYKNANARYRDFEKDFDARDLVRQLMVVYGKWKSISQNGLDANNELIDDEIFDDTMLENLMCPPTDLEGLIALFYRNIWAMAELREELKVYEDAEEQGLLLKLPCKRNDILYFVDGIRFYEMEVLYIEPFGSEHDGKIYNIYLDCAIGYKHCKFSDIGKTVFLTKEEAEQALQRMKEGETNEMV